MMHYGKGENIEKQLTREELPFKDFLSKDTKFLWMHVNGGTKVNNVLTYAKNALDKGEYKHIVWSGNGGGVVKTVSCAEILKRSYPLYQVTRTCYITVEEHWKPQMEGLEEIVANREIPSLHIFMSLEPIDDNVRGLQKPNTTTDFWVYNNDQNTATTSKKNNNSNNKHKSRNQDQERPKYNQNKNRQTLPNVSNNQDSLSVIEQKKHIKQKRRRNYDSATSNPTKENNLNQPESNDD